MSAAEIGRSVPDRPEFLASSWGRIVRQPSYGPMPLGGLRKYEPKPIYGQETKANANASHVYMGAYFKGIGNVKIHQLVCAAFHGRKPFEKAVVIHIDEDGKNNRPENLKWGTQKENLNAPGFLNYCRSRPNPRAVHKQRTQEQNQ